MSLPLALGLFSVRDLYREDFDACMRRTAAMGYTGVECFGAPGLHDAQAVCDALARHGLTLVGWHLPIESLEGDRYAATLAYLQAVGCPRAVVPSYAREAFASREGTLQLAQRMEAIRAALAPHGILLGYHNHEAEFVPLADGTLPWALLMDSTGMFGQLDTGNAMASKTPGIDPAALVSRWPGRADTIHLKPYSHQDGFATMAGEDDTDWAALVAAAQACGTKWLIVEYEDPKYAQLEGAQLIYQALKPFI